MRGYRSHEVSRFRSSLNARVPEPAVVSGLTVSRSDGAPIVQDVTLRIEPGEVLGLIGESGSGKTTVAQSWMGYSRVGLTVTEGTIRAAGRDIRGLAPDELSRLRGTRIAYVPQDTGNSLNPLLTVGNQLHELRRRVARERPDCDLEGTLKLVGLEPGGEFYRKRAHQLSGGQQQRLLLAMAFIGKPDLVVLDEPTTALDVVTQHMVLEALDQLKTLANPAVLYVSHDLALVHQIADSIAVMYAGRVVEHGPRGDIVAGAAHPYTRGLIGAVPRIDSGSLPIGIPGRTPDIAERHSGCCFDGRCPSRIDKCSVRPDLAPVPGRASEAACHLLGEMNEAAGSPAADALLHRNGAVEAIEPRSHPDSGVEVVARPGHRARVLVEGLTIRYSGRVIMANVSFQLPREGCTAVVGESGSGKSSMARVLSGLQQSDCGRLHLDGESVDLTVRRRDTNQLRKVQYIFQNPAGALNPRKTVMQTLRDSVRAFEKAARPDEIDSRIDTVLDQVALPVSTRAKYPAQMSGGERQRIAIARALIVRPQIVVCDEVTSALDVSVQASIARLLHRLCVDGEMMMIFVTHNISLVRSIADEVIVLRNGEIRQTGTTGEVFNSADDTYTRRLIDLTPSLAASRKTDV